MSELLHRSGVSVVAMADFWGEVKSQRSAVSLVRIPPPEQGAGYLEWVCKED